LTPNLYKPGGERKKERKRPGTDQVNTHTKRPTKERERIKQGPAAQAHLQASADFIKLRRGGLLLHYWLLESSSSRRVKVVVVAVIPALLLALVVRLERVIPELLKRPHTCLFACWLPALPSFLPSFPPFLSTPLLTHPTTVSR